MLKNFQIKYINPKTKRWSLEVFKNYISCKRTKMMIPKSFLDEMVEHFKDFKKFPTNEYYLIFSRILDNLQKISNVVGSNCTNLQNFLNFLRFRIIAKKVFKSSHMNFKEIKHLSSWVARHLRKHNFEKAGMDVGRLFSVLAENVDYLNVREKSSRIVKNTKKIKKTKSPKFSLKKQIKKSSKKVKSYKKKTSKNIKINKTKYQGKTKKSQILKSMFRKSQYKPLQKTSNKVKITN